MQPHVIWLTGLPAAGKTTLAREAQARLSAAGRRAILLDGDQLRGGLCSDLGFSPADRSENIRRAGEVARLLFEQGCIVLCAFISPYRQDRARVRALFPAGRFHEVYVTATPETRRSRDPKGLYARAGAGQVAQFTGLSAPYETPEAPELRIDTDACTVAQAVERICVLLTSRVSSQIPS